MLEAEALRQLVSVGDPNLGEWREWSGVAFHIRRRLSIREQARARLDVVDIRCTPEAVTRAMALGDLLAYAPPEILAHELGDAEGLPKEDTQRCPGAVTTGTATPTTTT